MSNRRQTAVAAGSVTLALVAGTAAAAAPYARAPLDRYLSPSRQAEIALARSAAPASVSDGAEVLALGADGYATAAKGRNGFVCVVERSWAKDFGDAEFWNPKLRAPICFNPASARSVLPAYLARTKRLLAGLSPAEAARRETADVAAGRLRPPQVGSMCFMMSKQGYLGDDAGGPWRPHLMYFLPPMDPVQWGADRPGSPVMAARSSTDPVTTFMVPVTRWSDGTPASPKTM